MRQGFFITFEGLDGSGKTTQLRRLQASLEAAGRHVVSTRQPGGTPLGDRVRNLLVSSRSEAEVGAIDASAEMALMFADRAQSLAQVIRPALEARSVVLCDRYTDSSEAYQGAGRELGPERILAMHEAVCGGFWPELTVLLLPPLESSLARARRRNERNARMKGTDEGRFEREGDGFYRRVYEQYETIARRDAQRVFLVADEAPIEVIADKILAETQRRLDAKAS
ncbi:dTMP kinase [Granulicella cerasi]|uniref:Thymidylate kinase n=1 Tax=Granulicella cerasi TaxID=741063 RepID=A0ABW1Z5J8_9BACT|nr:dTMP kinase [Granulicella cerasi]